MNQTHPETSSDRPVEGAEYLSLQEVEVYNQDRRSRVWRVEDDTGRSWVVKRFEQRPLWQKLTAALGQHPAQREADWHAKLIAAELPVVPIAAAGQDERGRHWLVKPWVGDDLVEWIRDGRLLDQPKLRHDVTRQLGVIAGRIMQMRVLHNDFKTRDVVIDEAGKVWLIDVGGCRGGKGTPLLAIALRMLTLLHRTARDAHRESQATGRFPTRTDRQRFFRAMLTAWPAMPDGLQHLTHSKEFD